MSNEMRDKKKGMFAEKEKISGLEYEKRNFK